MSMKKYDDGRVFLYYGALERYHGLKTIINGRTEGIGGVRLRLFIPEVNYISWNTYDYTMKILVPTPMNMSYTCFGGEQ